MGDVAPLLPSNREFAGRPILSEEEDVPAIVVATPPAKPEPELCAVCGDAPLGPPYEDIALCPMLTEWSGEIPERIMAYAFAVWTTGSQQAQGDVARFAG